MGLAGCKITVLELLEAVYKSIVNLDMIRKDIRLTKEQARALEEEAKKLGISQSEVVHRILSEVFADIKPQGTL